MKRSIREGEGSFSSPVGLTRPQEFCSQALLCFVMDESMEKSRIVDPPVIWFCKNSRIALHGQDVVAPDLSSLTYKRAVSSTKFEQYQHQQLSNERIPSPQSLIEIFPLAFAHDHSL